MENINPWWQGLVDGQLSQDQGQEGQGAGGNTGRTVQDCPDKNYNA